MIDWDCKIQPHIEPFFDSDSNTFSYLVQDPNSLSCAVIDSVLDFDYPSGSIGYESADGIIDIIKRRGLDLQWLIESLGSGIWNFETFAIIAFDTVTFLAAWRSAVTIQ